MQTSELKFVVVQSKRMKQLATTRQNIARLLCELELSPNTSFEHDVVYDPESVSVTADSMRAVKRYNDEVQSYMRLIGLPGSSYWHSSHHRMPCHCTIGLAYPGVIACSPLDAGLTTVIDRHDRPIVDFMDKRRPVINF